MSELEKLAKTSYEIFLLWNEQVDKQKWVLLEGAQKIEKDLKEMAELFEKSEDENERFEKQIVEANKILIHPPIVVFHYLLGGNSLPVYEPNDVEDFLKRLREVLKTVNQENKKEVEKMRSEQEDRKMAKKLTAEREPLGPSSYRKRYGSQSNQKKGHL